MQVVQATLGTFHSFDLAAQLLRRGSLRHIYSTFPWRRLQREGIPREYVTTFPWLHTLQFMAGRHKFLPQAIVEGMSFEVLTTFDAWLARRVPACDALISLSGTALTAGRRVQEGGGAFFCDRGSTHHAFQHRVLREEYRRWNFPYTVRDERVRRRELAIYDQCDAITVPSQVCRRSFVTEGVPAGKVYVVPYGVQLERFTRVAEPDPQAFDVLFVGSVSLRKGVPYLLQAFERLQHSRKRLRIVGGVSAEVEQLLPRLPKNDVEFLGTVPQEQLPGLFSTSHVLVLPSVEEGLALVQGQALACGCPVLATEATGAADLFTDGEEGFILPDTDVAALTTRMQQLADDPALQQRMSEAALRRVQSLGGWDTYGQRWDALLRQVTGKP